MRWCIAYPLCPRHIEEMMHPCSAFVDRVTVHRWVINVLPVLAAVLVDASAPLVEAGEWTRLTLRFQVGVNIFTAPLTASTTRWIFCSLSA